MRTSEVLRPLVEVRSLRFDGSLKRAWHARLERVAGQLLVLEGVFAEEVRHPLLGTISAGTHSTEFFWTDRWYSVFRFREPSGPLRNFYGNLNTPPRLERGILSFVDLDIDVLVEPDLSYRILDEDEFEQHSKQFRYTEQFRRSAFRGLDELLALIKLRGFPFDQRTEAVSSLDEDLEG